MQPREIEINTGRMVFSGLEWGDPEAKPVLALHGWMDNAASFTPVAPLLKGIRLIAVDMAGHGRSQHRPADMDYCIWNYVEDIIDIADTLDLQNVSLIGHSLGAVVSVMVSTVLESRVEKLICIDGLYPWPRKAEDAPTVLSDYIEQRRAFRKGKTLNRFKTMEHAVRIRSFGQFPVSRESSAMLVERALYLDGDAWTWRTDPRLTLSSPLRFTPEQAMSFVDALRCEAHMFYAEKGVVDSIVGHSTERFPNVCFHSVEGTHHFHMDGSTEFVAERVNDILN
ncbi:alpha/beta hydrolase [Endozoicomonas montiporae]|uniref:Putative hydrolase n=1 Tax=Endozoicomonas montiporae CL-33 TaxID=570277 RepID=A0A142BC25_9GAMM|nr:alpha/beta hydrolase [Endozoicomonas montiporae]AMO56301.1 putative hydrolase [Endozoicomonas montiporae CL-33]